MKSLIAVLSISLTVTIAGCGTMSTPTRPAYDAPDLVQAFDSADIVGTWKVTVLNPLEGEQVSSLVYTYEADGKWLFQVEQNTAQLEMVIEGYGSWEIRITENRIVWVVEEDGQAMQLDRM